MLIFGSYSNLCVGGNEISTEPKIDTKCNHEYIFTRLVSFDLNNWLNNFRFITCTKHVGKSTKNRLSNFGSIEKTMDLSRIFVAFT